MRMFKQVAPWVMAAVLFPTFAGAQTGSRGGEDHERVALSQQAGVRPLAPDWLRTAHPAPQPAPSRDTLTNGAIIGALVGAASLGAVAAFICRLEQEPRAGNCAADTLLVAAVGAGIGAAAGIAVDAVFTQRRGVAVRLGIVF